MNFEFEKGKKYAIVGGSGSGKSTLVKLIMHYYDDIDGDIYLDNQEIREIDKGSLYNKERPMKCLIKTREVFSWLKSLKTLEM